jgi:hypothetical protein
MHLGQACKNNPANKGTVPADNPGGAGSHASPPLSVQLFRQEPQDADMGCSDNDRLEDLQLAAGTFPGSSSIWFLVKDATLPVTQTHIPAAQFTSPHPEALQRVPLPAHVLASMDVTGDSHRPATLQACSEPELGSTEASSFARSPSLLAAEIKSCNTTAAANNVSQSDMHAYGLKSSSTHRISVSTGSVSTPSLCLNQSTLQWVSNSFGIQCTMDSTTAVNSTSLLFPTNYCTPSGFLARDLIFNVVYMQPAVADIDRMLSHYKRQRAMHPEHTGCMLVVPSTETSAQHPDMAGFELVHTFKPRERVF